MKLQLDYEKCIPAAIPMKLQEVKMISADMPKKFTDNIYKEASKVSKLFRDKVAADRQRLGLGQ